MSSYLDFNLLSNCKALTWLLLEIILELLLLVELLELLLFKSESKLLLVASISNSVILSSIILIILFLVFNSFTTKYLVKLSLKVI